MSLELQLLHEISDLLRSQREDIVTLRKEFDMVRNELGNKLNAIGEALTLAEGEAVPETEYESIVGRVAERRHSATLERVKGSSLPSGW